MWESEILLGLLTQQMEARGVGQGGGAFTYHCRCCRPPGWSPWAGVTACGWPRCAPTAGWQRALRWQRWRPRKSEATPLGTTAACTWGLKWTTPSSISSSSSFWTQQSPDFHVALVYFGQATENAVVTVGLVFHFKVSRLHTFLSLWEDDIDEVT